MSVINQMLRDLDKRQNEQLDGVNQSVAIPAKRSTGKLVFIILIIVAIVNVIAIFSWQLYSENKQLKAQAQQVQENAIQTQVSIENSAQPALKANDRSDDTLNNALPMPSKTNTQNTQGKPTVAKKDEIMALPGSATENFVDNDEVDFTEQLQESTGSNNSIDNSMPSTDEEKSVVHNGTNKVHDELPKTAKKPKLKSSVDSEMVVAKSSLSISRTQLTPQALAANKIAQAEQAMERNDLAKAESLFEEVLLVMPEHETARKQLAALWYGKKYYQDAVNLLSQGIALAPQQEEMRLMSARIYYEQGQARQAYNILMPIKASTSTEVQALLANLSAELNEHESAIIAYRALITQEPEVGRWWLGLAVSMDTLGKFVPARDAYKQAIARNNLSMSAMQFARQRLIELGE